MRDKASGFCSLDFSTCMLNFVAAMFLKRFEWLWSGWVNSLNLFSVVAEMSTDWLTLCLRLAI